MLLSADDRENESRENEIKANRSGRKIMSLFMNDHHDVLYQMKKEQLDYIFLYQTNNPHLN